jgi:hypothetical protein
MMMNELIERIKTYIPKGDGYNDQFAHDLAEVVEALQQSQWVSVEDELPETDGAYLCRKRDSQFTSYEVFIWASMWRTIYRHGITHWMPLPTPPAKEQGS